MRDLRSCSDAPLESRSKLGHLAQTDCVGRRSSDMRTLQTAREKDELERGAIMQFVASFNALVGRRTLAFAELLRPPWPDARCMYEGRAVFVEVAHVYGTGSDARLILGRTRHPRTQGAERLQSALVPLSSRVLGPLNRVIRTKCSKTYEGSPIWLLLRSAFPLWTVDDFRRCRREIELPKAHPFAEVWLLCGPRVDFGLLRLDDAR